MANRKIYALLVGIDDYPIASHKLNGCVNDVNAMHEFLEFRCKAEGLELHIKKLLDKEATRQNVVSGFLDHLCQATNEDDAFFYYSGHGAQESAPPEFWATEPDRLNESMVCVDSRTDDGGVGDIVDKEIGYLLWKVSHKNPRLLVVMDCCHSGSGTRSTAPTKPDITTRQIPTTTKARPIQNYLGYSEGFYNFRADGTVFMGMGNYVALAAARSNEFAKETTLDGQKRGAFNFSLIETLKAAKGDMGYGDLMARVKAKVISLVPDQNPQLEVYVPRELDAKHEPASSGRSFLGGIPPKEDFLRIYYREDINSKQGGWVVNFGQMHGLPKSFPAGEPPVCAVFNFADASGNKDYKLSIDKFKGNDVAEAVIKKVEKDYSIIEFRDHPERSPFPAPDRNNIYKAKLVSSPLKPVLFFIEGSDADTETFRNTMQEDQYIKFTTNPAEAKYRVKISQGEFTKKYEFLRNEDDKKVAKDVRGTQKVTPNNQQTHGEGKMAEVALSYVKTIGKWEKILELNNPDTSFQDNSVQIQIIPEAELNKNLEEQIPMDSTNGIELIADIDNDGMMITPFFVVRIKNNTAKKLYCTGLNMLQSYGIQIEKGDYATGLSNAHLEANRTLDAFNAEPLALLVHPDLIAGGEYEEKFILKVFYSTEEFSPEFTGMFEQDPLPYPAAPDKDQATRGIVKKSNGADWSVAYAYITVKQPK